MRYDEIGAFPFYKPLSQRMVTEFEFWLTQLGTGASGVLGITAPLSMLEEID
jgi:hypothetical protein